MWAITKLHLNNSWGKSMSHSTSTTNSSATKWTLHKGGKLVWWLKQYYCRLNVKMWMTAPTFNTTLQGGCFQLQIQERAAWGGRIRKKKVTGRNHLTVNLTRNNAECLNRESESENMYKFPCKCVWICCFVWVRANRLINISPKFKP